VTDRWTLTAEFDTVEESQQLDIPLYDPEMSMGAAAGFYDFMVKQWSDLLDEERDEYIVWENEIVTLHADVLDHLVEALRFLVMRVVPKKVTLVRNDKEGEGNDH